MPYTVNLELASSAASGDTLPDYFSPEFQQAVERRAAELCSGLAIDPWLIGYYTDNQIRWVPDRWAPGASHDSVLEIMLKKAPASPGRQRAVAFMKARGRAPEDVRDDDRVDFLEVAGTEYGRICRDAIRRHDQNHLILGSYFNGLDRIELSKALAPYYDVFSFNPGGFRAPLYKLGEIARVTGKPTIVTGFNFRAMDSGLPNPAGQSAATATEPCGSVRGLRPGFGEAALLRRLLLVPLSRSRQRQHRPCGHGRQAMDRSGQPHGESECGA